LGELAAEEFDEAARARPPVSAQQAHSVKKYQKIEDFRVPQSGGGGALDLLLLDFVEECGERGVEFARQRSSRQPFVDEAGGKRLVSLGESLKGCQNIRVSGRGLRSTEFGDGKMPARP